MTSFLALSSPASRLLPPPASTLLFFGSTQYCSPISFPVRHFCSSSYGEGGGLPSPLRPFTIQMCKASLWRRVHQRGGGVVGSSSREEGVRGRRRTDAVYEIQRDMFSRSHTLGKKNPPSSQDQYHSSKITASTSSSLVSSSSSSSLDGSGHRPSQTVDGRIDGKGDRTFTTPGKQRRSPYKTAHTAPGSSSSSTSFTNLRIRPRDPWGLQQLRDSWSEDAMSSSTSENMSERTHRAYRYHPEEFRRFHIKYAAYLTIPCIIIGMSAGYYFHTGKPIWKGDPQEILNYIRRLDTSPRSALYAFSEIYDHEAIPEHIRRYREEKKGEKEQREDIFRVIHTVCRKPTPRERKEILLLAEERKRGKEGEKPSESTYESS